MLQIKRFIANFAQTVTVHEADANYNLKFRHRGFTDP